MHDGDHKHNQPPSGIPMMFNIFKMTTQLRGRTVQTLVLASDDCTDAVALTEVEMGLGEPALAVMPLVPDDAGSNEDGRTVRVGSVRVVPSICADDAATDINDAVDECGLTYADLWDLRVLLPAAPQFSFPHRLPTEEFPRSSETGYLMVDEADQD